MLKQITSKKWRKNEQRKATGAGWAQRLKWHRARKAPLGLDAMFPLSFVPESSSTRRAASV